MYLYTHKTKSLSFGNLQITPLNFRVKQTNKELKRNFLIKKRKRNEKSKAKFDDKKLNLVLLATIWKCVQKLALQILIETSCPHSHVMQPMKINAEFYKLSRFIYITNRINLIISK